MQDIWDYFLLIIATAFSEINVIGFLLEYFNDILQFEEINVSSFFYDDIVEIVKDEIDKENYIIFDCNHAAFDDNSDPNENAIHEVLLYGYDDKKMIMYTTCLMKGKFVETELPYDLLKRGYKFAFEYYKNNPQEMYNRRSWFYQLQG